MECVYDGGGMNAGHVIRCNTPERTEAALAMRSGVLYKQETKTKNIPKKKVKKKKQFKINMIFLYIFR